MSSSIGNFIGHENLAAHMTLSPQYRFFSIHLSPFLSIVNGKSLFLRLGQNWLSMKFIEQLRLQHDSLKKASFALKAKKNLNVHYDYNLSQRSLAKFGWDFCKVRLFFVHSFLTVLSVLIRFCDFSGRAMVGFRGDYFQLSLIVPMIMIGK